LEAIVPVYSDFIKQVNASIPKQHNSRDAWSVAYRNTAPELFIKEVVWFLTNQHIETE
jgi:hypothetical protein